MSCQGEPAFSAAGRNSKTPSSHSTWPRRPAGNALIGLRARIQYWGVVGTSIAELKEILDGRGGGRGIGVDLPPAIPPEEIAASALKLITTSPEAQDQDEVEAARQRVLDLRSRLRQLGA